LAKVYRKTGRTEEAKEVWRRAMENKVAAPVEPQPVNRDPAVPVTAGFDWEDCRGAERYELYLWKTGEQTPDRPVARGLKRSEYRPKRALRYDTVYFWKVKAIGQFDEESSELWFFRTETGREAE
jgi:pentatricopeptide repeat protein